MSPPTATGSWDQQPQGLSRNGIDLSFDLLAPVAPHSVTPAAMADPRAGVPSPGCNIYGSLHYFSDAGGVLKEKLL